MINQKVEIHLAMPLRIDMSTRYDANRPLKLYITYKTCQKAQFLKFKRQK